MHHATVTLSKYTYKHGIELAWAKDNSHINAILLWYCKRWGYILLFFCFFCTQLPHHTYITLDVDLFLGLIPILEIERYAIGLESKRLHIIW